nr:prostaglandin E synthase 3-like [Saimiri boliviensis boliviensis]
MQPASAKWCYQLEDVPIKFCVEDSKDVNVNFEKSKLKFSFFGGSDNFKDLRKIDPCHCVDPNVNWLSVDFNNWKSWEDDLDEDLSNFDHFSEIMYDTAGEDLPEVSGADADSQDSNEKMIWSKEYCRQLDFEKEKQLLCKIS